MKIGIFCLKSQCLNVFAISDYVRFGNRFLGDWNLNFSVHYDRAKCQDRIGENDIKIRLTVCILRAKTGKLKNLRLSVRQKSYYDFRHRTTILTRF